MRRRTPVEQGHGPPGLCALLAAAMLAACASTARTTAQAQRPRPWVAPLDRAVPATNARVQRAVAPAESDDASVGWSAALDVLLTAPREETRGPVAPSRPWDRITAPRYIDRFERRFALTPLEREALSREGFVVPERLSARSFAQAYRVAQRAELPAMITVDAVLHAVSSLHDPFVAHVEAHTLAPLLTEALQRMHRALAANARALPDETAADADLVLTVARSLLERDEGTVAPALGPSPAVVELVRAAREASPNTERALFGRTRVVDFTAFRPHGRAASSPLLARYHLATAWLAQVPLNLVSRSGRVAHPSPTPDTRETPREALLALALADLVAQGDARTAMTRLEHAWTILHGRREDLSLAHIAVLRDVVHITDLRDDDTWDRFRLVARNQPRAGDPSQPPPPITASIFGLRTTAGDNLLTDLVDPSVPSRATPTAPEAAWALGHDRARAWLDGALRETPGLDDALDRARVGLPQTFGTNDLPSLRMRALRELSTPAQGRTPTFMTADAWSDLRINATLAGYGQFLTRNDPPRDDATAQGAGQIPTVWVDPAPGFYRDVELYAERALALAHAAFSWSAARDATVQARDAELVRAFDVLSRVSQALRAVSVDELAGRVVSDAQTAFLASVVSPDAADGGPTGGWYGALFAPFEATRDRAAFASPWASARNAPTRAWIGASAPRLGLFVVDNGGMPFLALGPVARAWELAAPADTTPAQALTRGAYAANAPWSATWLQSQVAPPLAVTVLDDDARRRTLLVRSRQALARVTFELLDARGGVVAEATRAIDTAATRITLERRAAPTARARSGSRSARHRSRRGTGLRYIDNTPPVGGPFTLRVRTASFSVELPTAFARGARMAWGSMHPIDDRGEELALDAPE